MDNPLRRIERVSPSDLDRRLNLDRRSVTLILWQVLSATEVQPLAPPRVPPHLFELPPLLRIHGCVRLFLLDLEYALSPRGELRGLAKFACRLSLAVGIVLMCLAALLGCMLVVVSVTAVLMGQLLLVLWRLAQAVMLLLGLLVGAVTLWLLVRFIARSRRSGRT